MAKSCNQKIKILYLLQLFQESTDEEHVISMQKILELLGEKGIRAERKSIYDDLETLRQFGMDIRFRKERPSGYYLENNTACKALGEGDFRVPDAVGRSSVPERPKAPVWEKDEGEAKTLKFLCKEEYREKAAAYFNPGFTCKEKAPGLWAMTADLVPGTKFYGWLTMMGKGVQLVKPKKEAAAYRDYLKSIAKEYKGV